jgi:hypothetical protein
MGVTQTVGTTAGAITGVVTDSTGGVRPGVAIVVTGDALMGARTATSGGDGRYAIAALPPGDYTIVFTLAGFAREQREGVRVRLAFTATIHVVLRPAAQEEVIVTRDTPVVDARSTALGSSFDAATLANLPGSRGMGAILAATPSVHLTAAEVGATGRGVVGNYSAYGTFAANRPMIEGINVNGINPLGLNLDYGPFDEVSVGTGAHSVEWPAPGVQMQITTRSGGNRYGGSLYADVEQHEWQAFNIDADQVARGAEGSPAVPAREGNRLWSYYDLNAGAGGFIRRDRLWWYGSVRHQDAARQSLRFPVMPLETRFANYGGKLTGQIAGQHRLIAFGQTSSNDQPTRLDPFVLTANTAFHLSETSTSNSHAGGGVWKVEWNAVARDALFLEVRAGQFSGTRHERPNGFAPRSEDLGTLIVAGGGRDWQTGASREQLNGAASYAPAGGAGRHVLKAGGEVARAVSTESWWSGYPGDVLHVLRSGNASEVYLLQTPSQAENGLWAFAAYASDTWRVHRFTLTFGGRFDRYRVFRPAQQHPAGRFNTEPQMFEAVDNVIDWNVFAPRLGLVFDVSGDARTLLKVSAGQYWVPPAQEVGANANPNANQWWNRYAWSDLNGSGQWDEGEQIGKPIDSRGGIGVESLDPGLSLPYVREVTAFFEREVRPGAAVRTGVVWRGERDQFQRENLNRQAADFSVPILVSDPGPDNKLGSADDGPAVQAWQLTAEALDRPPLNIVRNAAHSASDYWTWELGVTVRGHRRWSINAGLVHTWTREQSNTYLGQPLRQYQNAAIPNDFINTDEDGRHAWRIWSARVSGTYFAPWDVRVTPFLRHQTGQPFGRTFTTRLLNYSPTVRILAEPIGTRRQANITIADVRMEKGFRMGNAGRLAGFLDVFNLFNANPESMSWSTDTFLKPLSIVSPRLARVGLKFDW